ncbi:MAG: hypothetical protein RL685_7797 [Pseudomonadota bacterium]|jgi:hypothetical protein
MGDDDYQWGYRKRAKPRRSPAKRTTEKPLEPPAAVRRHVGNASDERVARYDPELIDRSADR